MTTDKTNYALYRDLLKAFWDPSTLLFVLAFSLTSAIESPFGFIQLNSGRILDLVFPVAGTMVALALPAAQLSMALVSSAEKLAVRLLAGAFDMERATQYVRNLAVEHRRQLFPAWRAVVYAVCSFLLAIICAVGPFHLSTDIPHFDLYTTMTIASLSFLAAATVWFLPTAHFAFKLKAVDSILEGVDVVSGLQGLHEEGQGSGLPSSPPNPPGRKDG